VDKTIREEERTFFYRDEGAGIPVLLVHGFAEDGTIWKEAAARLNTVCRLLIPDLPGSGRSSPLMKKTSMESLAECLKNLLDRENIDRCIFIGHSMGGYITLAFAEIWPERVRAFGFFHSTAYSDSEEKKAARRKSIGFIREHGAAPYIRQSTPNLFASATRENKPELVEDMIRQYSGFSAEALTAYLEAMAQRPDRVSVLRDFTGPILFIIGQNDTVVPLIQSLEQSHIPRLSHIHILQAAGHMGMLEEPEAGTGSIRSFLNFINQS
jgi:pimeloyl-ACP methyl ester carboxylesterase